MKYFAFLIAYSIAFSSLAQSNSDRFETKEGIKRAAGYVRDIWHGELFFNSAMRSDVVVDDTALKYNDLDDDYYLLTRIEIDDGSIEIPYMAKYSGDFKDRCAKYLDLITTKGMLGFFKSADELKFDTNLFLASTVSFSRIIFVVPFSNLTKTYSFIIPINNDLIGQIERGEVTNLRYYFEEAGME